jgi:proteic killer suppression protein
VTPSDAIAEIPPPIGKRIPVDIRKRSKMRLDRINAAVEPSDLHVPPSHRLEALKRDRMGQHSIRINDQYRVCFIWQGGHAYEVEIADYH